MTNSIKYDSIKRYYKFNMTVEIKFDLTYLAQAEEKWVTIKNFIGIFEIEIYKKL